MVIVSETNLYMKGITSCLRLQGVAEGEGRVEERRAIFSAGNIIAYEQAYSTQSPFSARLLRFFRSYNTPDIAKSFVVRVVS